MASWLFLLLWGEAQLQVVFQYVFRSDRISRLYIALLNIPPGQSSAKLPVTRSLGQLVTQSLGHSVTLSLSHLVSQSVSQSVTTVLILCLQVVLLQAV